MSKKNTLDKYIPIVQFLSKVLGKNSEIILYDAVEKKVHYSVNPVADIHNTNRSMTDAEIRILESNRETIAQQDFLVNYRMIEQGFERLRGSSFFIKDEDNKLLAMMTINIRVNDYLKMRDIIEEYINGEESTFLEEKNKTFLIESFDYNFEDILNSTIQKEVNKLGIPPERLSTEEKNKVIAELDKKGTFLMKGSVQEVAKALNCAEVTIYRYLQNIKE